MRDDGWTDRWMDIPSTFSIDVWLLKCMNIIIIWVKRMGRRRLLRLLSSNNI